MVLVGVKIKKRKNSFCSKTDIFDCVCFDYPRIGGCWLVWDFQEISKKFRDKNQASFNFHVNL